MALGASRVDVIHLIARETLLRLGIGLIIGASITFWAVRFLEAQLFGLTPHDPVSFAVAALILSLVVILTTVRPLVRAMRTDPVVALRAE
jgi:ABC-type antimicrobial peptide transport system permease subunit